MDKNLEYINTKMVERTIKALEKNNMNGYFVKNEKDLHLKLEELVKENDLVACGGSMTLFELGVIDFIRNGKYNFLDRYEKGITPEKMKDLFRKSFSSDVFFTSTNAITEDGELYNVDGNGNRVAAMIYGPDKVIVIVGINKIVKDVKEAVVRNQRVAAPTNAQRLNINTPCKKEGICMDCMSSDRICCEYTLIKRQRVKGRIHVIFVDGNYGY